MLHRQASIAQVLGVTDAWHLGPSPSWPLVVVIIDEAHTFFHERKGTSPEVKAHNALVAELSRLVEELVERAATSPSSHAPHPAPPGMPSRPASATTAKSRSPSRPALSMGRWPAGGSASTPTSPRCC